MKSLFRLLVFCLIATGLKAALVVSVEGLPGSGETTWSFSGSYQTGNFSIANNDASFTGSSRSRSVLVNFFQHSLGDMSGEWISNANYNAVEIGVVGSAATITRGSQVETINGLFLDSNGSETFNAGRDNFAWFATGSYPPHSDLTFAGSLVLAADITTFGEGSTAINLPGDAFSVSSSSEITALSMQFTAIPEVAHTGLVLGGLTLGASLFWRRRR